MLIAECLIHGTTRPNLAYHCTLTGKPSGQGGRRSNMITWEVDDVLRELWYRIKCRSNGLREVWQGAGGLCGGQAGPHGAARATAGHLLDHLFGSSSDRRRGPVDSCKHAVRAPKERWALPPGTDWSSARRGPVFCASFWVLFHCSTFPLARCWPSTRSGCCCRLGPMKNIGGWRHARHSRAASCRRKV